MKRPIPLEQAVAMVLDGAVVMVGGFMGIGSPMRLIDELVRQRRKDVALTSNDTARPGVGVGRLFDACLGTKVIGSHIGTNEVRRQCMLDGRIRVELVPQGTLAERVRAAGFGAALR